MKIYTLYDKLSNRHDKLFTAENDAVAIRSFYNTIVKMKKEDMDYSQLTILRVCEIHDNPIVEYNAERHRTGYIEIIKDTETFDLLNVPEEMSEEKLLEEETIEQREEFKKYKELINKKN